MASQGLAGERYDELRHAAATIERVILQNAMLRDMPETRGRVFRVAGSPSSDRPHAVSVFARRYWRPAWVAGACGINSQADRIPHAKAVQMGVLVNEISFLRKELEFEGSVLFHEPKVLGHFGKYRLFGYADDFDKYKVRKAYSGILLMSVGDRVPWIAATAGEHLGLLEARYRQHAESVATALGGSRSPTLDPAKIRSAYEAMRRINPVEAEKFREKMEATRREADDPDSRTNRDHRGRAAINARANEEEFARFAEARRSLGPSGLAGRAYAGKAADGFPTRVALRGSPGAVPLVKMDPSFWDPANRGRVQTIAVEFAGRVPEDVMLQVMSGMDMRELERLLR